jgi:hypothetical protein
VKEMLKEVREVKVSGWVRLVIFLGLWVVFLNLLAGCGRGAATDTSSQVAEGSGVWRELAPGIRYQEENGVVLLDITPPLLTEESVRKFTEFAQQRMAQAAFPEEKESWEENLRFVKEQQVIWSDEELAASVLEGAFTSRFPIPLSEEQRRTLKEKLKEIVRQLKRYGPDNLPGDAGELPSELRIPEGGITVGPDTLPILVEHLSPQGLFPSCSLAASAMPTTASPGAKAYATASCSTGSVIWGQVETQTSARAGTDWPPPCYYSGWPSSQCMSVAYGNTGCYSSAWSGYYYQWANLRIYSGSRSASNSRCF